VVWKQPEFPLTAERRYRLNYPAATYRFTFGKRISCYLLCSVILLNAQSSLAFFSNGKINDDISYRSLHVEILETKTKTKSKTKRGGCYLVGEILNNTNIVQDGVSVTFYAFDFFDHSLWKQTVRINILDPFYKSGKGFSFRKKLSNCEEPAKFQFKVTGVKREDFKKAIKDNPNPKTNSNTKDPGSVDSRQKGDSGTVDIITTPIVPIQKYLIILTNGKEISTDSCREQDNMVFLNKDGGEVQISKDKVSEIRKQN
jgi:hypothetical protein